MIDLVSIHAPWEGCDRHNTIDHKGILSFNSRTLGRVRQPSSVNKISELKFQFTHPGKGATAWFGLVMDGLEFQFTHPGKGATRREAPAVTPASSFNSRTLGRVRQCGSYNLTNIYLSFNSRTLGRVRQTHHQTSDGQEKVSIHAPWEGCDLANTYRLDSFVVSIHAPWEGCDASVVCLPGRTSRFNSRTLGRVRLPGRPQLLIRHEVSIHAPWEGCDQLLSSLNIYCLRFQFTHPGKGATGLIKSRMSSTRFVSIHAPWEGCDSLKRLLNTTKRSFNSRTLGRVRLTFQVNPHALYQVSIHAPWEGCDVIALPVVSAALVFQFTHPGKGATSRRLREDELHGVSIHAPWEGCDTCHSPPLALRYSFNSRTLGRVRRDCASSPT